MLMMAYVRLIVCFSLVVDMHTAPSGDPHAQGIGRRRQGACGGAAVRRPAAVGGSFPGAQPGEELLRRRRRRVPGHRPGVARRVGKGGREDRRGRAPGRSESPEPGGVGRSAVRARGGGGRDP